MFYKVSHAFGKTWPLILLGFLPLFGAAQETATLRGVVQSPAGAPLSLIKVEVLGSSMGAYTDSSGRFQLRAPAGDSLRLRFSYLGEEKSQRTLPPLAPNSTRSIRIALDPSLELPTFEVREQTDRTRTFIDKVEVDDIDLMPNAGGGVEGLIKLLPGVQSGNELSSSYSVRGGNFDENLVYINDIEIYRPFLARAGRQEGLSIINPDLVQNLFFSAGGFEARYGDKLSSVLDITYKKPTKFGGSVTGSLLGGRAHLEGASENRRFTYLVGARSRTNQYLLNSLDTEGDYRPLFVDFQGYWTYDLSPELELSLLNYYGRNRFEQEPRTQTTRFGTVQQAFELQVFYEGQERTTAETILNGMTLRQQAGPNTDLRYTVSHFNTYETESFDVIGSYRIFAVETDLGSDDFGEPTDQLGIGGFHNNARNVLEANIYSVQHDGIHRYGEGHELRWGVRYRRENINDRLKEWEYVDSAGFSLPRDPNDTLALYERFNGDIDLGNDRYTTYIQNGWLMSPRTNGYFTAGLRAHHWSFNEELVMSPRLSYSFEPNFQHNRNLAIEGGSEDEAKADIQIKLAAGMYHQPPFYREIRALDGSVSDSTLAQRSFHGVAGLVWKFPMWGRIFRWKAEAYYKHMWNLVPYDLENVRIRYRPAQQADGFAYGTDMQLYGEFVEGLPSWLSLSVLQVKEDLEGDFFTEEDANGEQSVQEKGLISRPTERVFSGALFFQDHLPDNASWRLHLRLNYATGLPFGPPNDNRYRNEFRMPAYRRVDLGVSKQLLDNKAGQQYARFFERFKSIYVRAEIFNLLGVRNTISYNWLRDVQGRQFAVPNLLTDRRFNISLRTEF